MNEAPHSNWGVMPVLFHVNGTAVPGYSFFILLGLLLGCAFYVWKSWGNPLPLEHKLSLLLAAVVGGIIGAKIPIWVQYFPTLIAAHDIMRWFPGRTIVGGLVGGVLAVTLVKYIFHIQMKTGDAFAPALALAITVGRLGCFCAGCCYGVPANLPWAVNFGDALPRHPTQIYEAIFAALLFGYLLFMEKKLAARTGELFRHFMLSYFTFRFLIEFLRQEPRPYLGLTLAQVVSFGIVLYYITVYRTRLANVEVATQEVV
ncbi:MAG: prolipoprotein diacylglyceryl transferase family protein [bacterium]